VARRWRLIHTGDSTGARNMAVDDLLLEQVAQTAGTPVLRFYGWAPPAVSIGYNQSAAGELDLARCQREGIDVVTRPSGGRAVLHWNELTYSLLWPDNEPALAGGVSASCQRVGQSLALGLRLFGVGAELEPGDVKKRMGSFPEAARGLCFASTSRWEVKCGGKKLVGSAQRRVRGGALQHGSLLLGPEHEHLSQLMCTGNALPRTSTHLGHWVKDIEPVRLRECLVAGFEQTLGVHFEQGGLSSWEATAAAKRVDRFAAQPRSFRGTGGIAHSDPTVPAMASG